MSGMKTTTMYLYQPCQLDAMKSCELTVSDKQGWRGLAITQPMALFESNNVIMQASGVDEQFQHQDRDVGGYPAKAKPELICLRSWSRLGDLVT